MQASSLCTNSQPRHTTLSSQSMVWWYKDMKKILVTIRPKL